MLFKSRLDADTKSTQELIVFCHGQERVLLPLPKTFEDAQVVARNEFSLTGELIFETDDVHGFEDTHVRVHQAAWEGISLILRSVTIKAANSSSPVAVARPRPSETLSSGSRRLSSQKRMSMTGPPPVRLSGAPSTLAPAARIVERQSLSARKSPLPTSSAQFPAMPAYKEAGPSSYKSSPPSRRSPAPRPAQAAIEELDDDEEEVRLLSPKKKNTRPRIMSDYGEDRGPDDTDEAPEDVRKASAESSDEEEFDQLDDADFVVSAGLPGRSQPRASKVSRTSSASIVELDGPPPGWTDKTERSKPVRQLDAPQPEPKVKTEKIEPKLEPASSRSQEPQPAVSQSQSQPTGKSDESFLIMIEYADDPDSRSLFKTRARHIVSKVLMQACRTFELQAHYHAARLVLVVEEEDEETGEVVYQRKYTCSRNETMGEAGAEPNAKFLVEIAEEDEEDE
ncbi:hypothetical protein LXA43DRAFT_1062162 [Ganoderma leucocontextum]|nr:hypothetical protein LXA43DRAFT_1062162 [Ganoderma leucocontextum]